jgi:LysR family transcriptional regulator, regulator of abg operon
MRFTQFRDFLAVIKAGSVRGGARALGISQPALTKSIRQLEEELHAKLLQRSGRGAIATRAGKAFLARARVIQAELGKIEEDLNELRGSGGGAAVIGVSPAAAVLLVPEAILRLHRRHPDVRIRLVEGLAYSLMPLVRDETLDFTVGQKGTEKLDRAIRFTPLIRVPMIVAGRRGHPHAAARSLRELADAAWVTFTPPGQGGFLHRLYSAAGLAPPRVLVQCESYTSALALMARTDALGVIVPQLLAEPGTKGILQQIKLSDPVPSLTYGIFRRADAPLSPAASALADAVAATARELARANR